MLTVALPLSFRYANGKEGTVGSGLTDEDRAKPPEVGATITVKYFEKSKDGV